MARWMFSKSQLWICFIGACAIIAGLIVMWIFRPAAQIVRPWYFGLAAVLFPLGILLILYGVQRTPRRIIRLVRAVGIYLLFGVIFWIVFIGQLAWRAGSLTALFPFIESLAKYPWLLVWGIVFWPTMTIQNAGIFGYWLFD